MNTPPDLLILTAVPQELRPIARALHLHPASSIQQVPIRSGDYRGTSITLAATGPGISNAERIADLLFRELRPKAVLMAGLAGGLTPDLALHEPIWATHVKDDQGNTWDADLLPPNATGRRGALLSLTRVLITHHEKKAAARHGAQAVDMETVGAARAATVHGVPWGALRVISDPTGEDLPLDFNHCVGPTGEFAIPLVLRHLARRPAALPGLLRFSGNVSRAANILAQTLAAALATGLPRSEQT